MRFLSRSLVALFLLCLTAGLLIYAGSTIFEVQQERAERDNRGQQARERVFTVTVAPIVVETIAPAISTYGEVVSGRTLELRAAAGGAIVEMAPEFREGSTVKAGQLLFKTDPASLTATLRLAETEFLEAQAELSEAREALVLAEDELTAAKEQEVLRQTQLERQRSLRTRGVGTEAALEAAEISLSSAGQTVLAKRQALANGKSRINRAEIALQRREINQAEAQRKLDDTSVFAEFDGVLSDVSGVLGGLVNPNEKMGQLIDTSALEVAFRVSSAQFTNLSSSGRDLRDAEIALSFPGFADAITAQIDRVSAAVADGTTGRELIARIDGFGQSILQPGDFVGVTITEPPLADVVVVPTQAITAGGDILLIGDNNRLDAVTVPVLRKQNDSVIVDAAAYAGRLLVTKRAPQLGQGIRVEPKAAGNLELEEKQMVTLSADEQNRLLAAIEANTRMPAEIKTRIMDTIRSGEMEKESYDRLTSRMARAGGGGGQGGDAGGETVTLSEDQRKALAETIKANPELPDQAKERIAARLADPDVPKRLVERFAPEMLNQDAPQPTAPQAQTAAGAAAASEAEMVALTDDQRSKMVAFIEGNSFIPDDRKATLLDALAQPEIPKQMYDRISSRMGG